MKRKINLVIFLWLTGSMFLMSCKRNNLDENDKQPQFERSYEFSNGVIPRNVLESYLSRAITQAEFLNSGGFYNDGPYPDNTDDIRMLKNIGAKFIGRAIYSWNLPENFNDPAFLSNAKVRIEEMHRFDTGIIFQACIFEIVSTKVNQIPVPTWVFDAYSLPVVQRNFVYGDMLNQQGQFVNHWGNGASVPDISRQETQMFFYFMACQYMDIGIEAIHWGQVELMAMTDRNNNFSAWSALLAKVRETAKSKARRGTILCDGHLPGGGVVIDGKLLFDFVSFPLRLKELSGEPQKCVLQKFYLDALYGRTKGGVTPSGWTCERLPYIVEFDNFGISDHAGVANLADHFAWGWDEISWFSNQPETYRNEFLEYAAEWIAKTDPNGYLQMPGSRVTTGTDSNRYRANTRSSTCALGKNQEETIKKIWNK